MHRKKIQLVPVIALGLWLLPLAFALGHGISHADKKAMISGGNLQYLWLGATHMLTGYDHLLFIFGVIFFLTGFRDIVKFITAFTIGHSITLLFATIWGISANYYLVDAVIAISVIYKGFENLDGFKKYIGVSSPNLLWVVFGFGLIHGFGLSTRLQQLPLGKDGFILRILSFNVGVELGQILALTGMLLIIAVWRNSDSFTKFSGVANTGLIIAGSLLFLMQMHGYAHTAHPKEFGSHKKNHDHDHDDDDHDDDDDDDHDDEKKGHTHGDKGHSHGKKSHSHRKKEHSHGDKGHSHGAGKVHTHGKKTEPLKRNAKTKPAPKKVDKKEKHIHSHDGKPHSH